MRRISYKRSSYATGSTAERLKAIEAGAEENSPTKIFVSLPAPGPFKQSDTSCLLYADDNAAVSQTKI